MDLATIVCYPWRYGYAGGGYGGTAGAGACAWRGGACTAAVAIGMAAVAGMAEAEDITTNAVEQCQRNITAASENVFPTMIRKKNYTESLKVDSRVVPFVGCEKQSKQLPKMFAMLHASAFLIL